VVSPPSSSSSPPLHSFPSDRNSKKQRTDIGDAVISLGSALSTALEKQMEMQREDAKLAREQMAMQQQSMMAMIAALTARRSDASESL